MKQLLALILWTGAAAANCDRAFENDDSISPFVINLICHALTREPAEFVKCRDHGRFREVGDFYEFEVDGLAAGRARLGDAGAKTPAVDFF